jgi:hypothetical protein
MERLMTLHGLIAFASYILHIYYRWARVTFRRYGVRGLLDSSYRPKRAGVGTGRRVKSWEVAHRNLTGGTRVWALLRDLDHERALA